MYFSIDLAVPGTSSGFNRGGPNTSFRPIGTAAQRGGPSSMGRNAPMSRGSQVPILIVLQSALFLTYFVSRVERD